MFAMIILGIVVSTIIGASCRKYPSVIIANSICAILFDRNITDWSNEGAIILFYVRFMVRVAVLMTLRAIIAPITFDHARQSRWASAHITSTRTLVAKVSHIAKDALIKTKIIGARILSVIKAPFAIE